jgi:2-polyprenyl-3-methyl-5-hydroxy-6-metoxy-1,4-benzoquinol methylase
VKLAAQMMPEMKIDRVSGKKTFSQCPVCNCKDSDNHFCVDKFTIRQCSECDCKYVINPPSKKELENYYNREQWFNGGEPGGYRDYDEQTVSSLNMIKEIFEEINSDRHLSILDLGCGYGSHLELAADRGWQCFGVEPSDHARAVAQLRLEGKAMIVKSINELIPHCFDLILMLDVIEHVSNPVELLYPLYNIGAIQGKTKLILTTPNAGSRLAISDPVNWPYHHPPSHLTYYNEKSLNKLLKKLRFSEITIKGIHANQTLNADPSSLEDFEGLEVQASGSNFIRFMQERYVPSTCSEIAEYEHMPRYQYALSLAPNRTILDFGCGTGYGSSILATSARAVVGVDIDESALEWARETHRKPTLEFRKNSDFGASLPSQYFDLVTCFEMIEHVTADHQQLIIDSFIKVLKPDGVLLISTPNPDITALYGDNPYHLCELTRDEFKALLRSKFKFVNIIDQHALASILFASGNDAQGWQLDTLRNTKLTESSTLGYLALCSQQEIGAMKSSVYVDNDAPYIPLILDLRKNLLEAKVKAYEFEQTLIQLRSSQQGWLSREQEVLSREQEVLSREQKFLRREQELLSKQQELLSKEQGLLDREQALQRHPVSRISNAVKRKISWLSSSEK